MTSRVDGVLAMSINDDAEEVSFANSEAATGNPYLHYSPDEAVGGGGEEKRSSKSSSKRAATSAGSSSAGAASSSGAGSNSSSSGQSSRPKSATKKR